MLPGSLKPRDQTLSLGFRSLWKLHWQSGNLFYCEDRKKGLLALVGMCWVECAGVSRLTRSLATAQQYRNLQPRHNKTLLFLKKTIIAPGSGSLSLLGFPRKTVAECVKVTEAAIASQPQPPQLILVAVVVWRRGNSEERASAAGQEFCNSPSEHNEFTQAAWLLSGAALMKPDKVPPVGPPSFVASLGWR